MLAHSGLPGNLQQAQLSWSGERLQNTFPGLVVVFCLTTLITALRHVGSRSDTLHAYFVYL